MKKIYFWFFIGILSFLILSTLFLSPNKIGLYGDEATYLMQAQSLAYDFDLRYTETDLRRLFMDGWQTGPQGLFLVRNDRGELFYAKPYLYAAAAAPLVRIFESKGFFVFNSLILVSLLFISFLYLAQKLEGTSALAVAFLYYLFSTAYFFVFAIYTDLFIALIFLLALFFWRYDFSRSLAEMRKEEANVKKSPMRRGAPRRMKIGLFSRETFSRAIGLKIGSKMRDFSLSFLAFLSQGGNYLVASIFFGLSIYQKPPLAAFAGLMLLEMLFRRKLKATFVCSFLLVTALFLTSSVNFYQTGRWSPYSGDRMYVRSGQDLALTEENLQQEELQGVRTGVSIEGIAGQIAGNPLGWGSSPRILLPNLYYFLLGRQTGLLIYTFPAFLFLLLLGYKGNWKKSMLIWGGILAYVFFYLLYTPNNYYGGATSFGNRYLLQILPAFLFLASEFPPRRFLYSFGILTALVGSLFLGPYLLSPQGVIYDHSRIILKRPFAYLPVELTQLDNLYNDYPQARVRTAEGLDLFQTDEDSFLWEEEGAWIKGRSRGDFIVRAESPLNSLRLKIGNGPMANQVTVQLDTIKYSDRFEPHEVKVINFDLSRLRKEAIMVGYHYRLSVSSREGFVPLLDLTGSQDTRYLGVFLFFPQGDYPQEEY
ncbi:MAG: hypothetical protein DDT18_00023 [Actinobacteria bacterium]|nr:hypothetical protein [Actinomycetota bacterium]